MSCACLCKISLFDCFFVALLLAAFKLLLVVCLCSGCAQGPLGEHVYAQVEPPLKQVFIYFYGLQDFALLDIRFAAKVADTGRTDTEAASTPVNVASLYVAMFYQTGLSQPVPGTVEAERFGLSNEAILSSVPDRIVADLMLNFPQWLVWHDYDPCWLLERGRLEGDGRDALVNRHADNVLDQIRSIVCEDLIYAVDLVNLGPQQGLGVAVLSHSKVVLFPLPSSY